MKPIGDKIIVKFFKSDIESIYSKKIVREDGSIVDLWHTMPVDEIDERSSTRFVQIATVTEVSEEIDYIFPGDLAIVDYSVMNDNSRIIEKTDGNIYAYINVSTLYHNKDEVAYANRRIDRDRTTSKKGDFAELSAIYGVIRGEELISFSPYVFLENQSNKVIKVASKIIYEETQKTYIRKILSMPSDSRLSHRFKTGDSVLVSDADVFSVKIWNDKKIDCVIDSDIHCTEATLREITAR